MSSLPQAFDLAVAYGASAAGMLLGLLLMRAGRASYFRLPAYSAMVMALTAVLWNLGIAKHLSAQTKLLHGDLLFYAAIALYATVGLLVGLGLGRLTRKWGHSSIPGNGDAPP